MECLPVISDDGPRRAPHRICLPAGCFTAPGAAARVGAIGQSGMQAGGDPLELAAYYAERALALKKIGAELILLHGFGGLYHARLAALGAREAGLPVLVCIDCGEGEPESLAEPQTAHGDSALACLLCLQELGIAAFGLAGSFERVEPLLRVLYPYAKTPLLAAPLPDREPEVWVACARWVLEAGARLFAMADSPAVYLEALLPLLAEYECAPFKAAACPGGAPILLADPGGAYYLYEDFSLSEPVEMSVDMAQAILEAEEEGADALLFEIADLEDAENFVQNIAMARRAVCILAHDAGALEYCLLSYPGRALLDSRSEMEREALERLAREYGALIR